MVRKFNEHNSYLSSSPVAVVRKCEFNKSYNIRELSPSDFNRMNTGNRDEKKFNDLKSMITHLRDYGSTLTGHNVRFDRINWNEVSRYDAPNQSILPSISVFFSREYGMYKTYNINDPVLGDAVCIFYLSKFSAPRAGGGWEVEVPFDVVMVSVKKDVLDKYLKTVRTQYD